MRDNNEQTTNYSTQPQDTTNETPVKGKSKRRPKKNVVSKAQHVTQKAYVTPNKNRPTKRRGAYIDCHNMPYDVAKWFSTDEERALFSKICHNFAAGRHIIDCSAISLYELQVYSTATRKRAMERLMGKTNYQALPLNNMHHVALLDCSDYMYKALLRGLENMLSALSLHIHMSPEKIANTGKAMKLHDGGAVYQGYRVRDVLSYTLQKEGDTSLATDEERTAQINTVLDYCEKYKTFTAIKGIPFSVLRYKNTMRIDGDNNILLPDVEAKYNLYRILGKETYEAYHFEKASVIDATVFESKLIAKIKKTLKHELTDIYATYSQKLQNDAITKALGESLSIEALVLATNSGNVHYIVKHFRENLEALYQAQTHPAKELTDEERLALFQIIFQYNRFASYNYLDGFEGTEVTALAISYKSCTYQLFERVVRYGVIPIVDEMYIFDTSKQFTEAELDELFEKAQAEQTQRAAQALTKKEGKDRED